MMVICLLISLGTIFVGVTCYQTSIHRMVGVEEFHTQQFRETAANKAVLDAGVSLTAIFIGGIVIFFVGLASAGAIRLWQIRDRPLWIDKKAKSVQYGTETICGPGMVRIVWLRRHIVHGDSGEPLWTYSIEFRLKDAGVVTVPPLCRDDRLEQAGALAELMADRLGVPLFRRE